MYWTTSRCEYTSSNRSMSYRKDQEPWLCQMVPAHSCACAVWFYSDILGHYTFIQYFLRMLGRKQIKKRHILTKGKLHNMGVELKASLKKSLCLFTFQCGISRSKVHTTTKLLKLQPCKMMEVQNLPLPNCEITIWYCTWFQESVFSVLDPEMTFCSDEARFTLSM